MSLVLIGMTNLGFGQLALTEFSNPFKNSIRSVHADVDYLDEVQGRTTPNHVKAIEKLVSDWDPTCSSEFTGETDTLMNVTFESEFGFIAVYYDSEGKIVSAEERFKNVMLPYSISRVIAKEYPGWNFEQSKYLLKYQEGRAAKKLFKVLISKDGQRKRLKISA